MKNFIMLPVMMMCLVFANSEAMASNSAHKYLRSNYASTSTGKTKKQKVSKKKSKSSAKLGKKSPKVAKVGKKYGRNMAAVSKTIAKKKKYKSTY